LQSATLRNFNSANARREIFRCPLCARRYTRRRYVFISTANMGWNTVLVLFLFRARYSFRVIDSQRNCSTTTLWSRILILSQLSYEKEREVDGVQSKNLPSHKIYCISLLFRNIIWYNYIPLWKYCLLNYVIYVFLTQHLLIKINNQG